MKHLKTKHFQKLAISISVPKSNNDLVYVKQYGVIRRFQIQKIIIENINGMLNYLNNGLETVFPIRDYDIELWHNIKTNTIQILKQNNISDVKSI